MTDLPHSLRCESCGASIPLDSPGGQCPPCLLGLGTAMSLVGVPEEALLDTEQLRDFGDYELIEEVARGGMGVVYRAWQRSARRDVAVKMIVTGQLATPESVARFRNEAAAATRLEHPNIVPVYEVGEYEMQHYLAMRFIPGRRNIAGWAKELPAAGRFRAIALSMAEITRAVAFAHERGVLHRDLKPSNILVDGNDEPQITDFGLAKFLDDPEAMTLTLSNAILGSPSYMAPEQAEPKGREVTTATDVYGLGAVLYELLAGRPPFTGETPFIVVRRVLEEAPKRLEAVPEDLETICLKCLEKEPSARYHSATELADDLERFGRGELIHARPIGTLALVYTWSRRHPAIAALLIALLVTFVAGFLGVVWQWRRADQARVALTAANTRLQSTVGHLEWRAIDELLERDYAPRVLTELATRLHADPGNWQAATYAISLVEQHPFALPVGPTLIIPEGAPSPQPIFTGDGWRVAFRETEQRIRVLNTATMRDAIPPLEHEGAAVSAFVFSPDDRLLAVGTKDGAVVLWQTFSGERVASVSVSSGPVRALAFSSDGGTLVAAAGTTVVAGGTASWLKGERPMRTLVPGFEPAHVICAKEGRRIVAWSAKKELPLCAWGAEGRGEFFSIESGQVSGATLDEAGRRLAIQNGPFEARVWDLEQNRRLCTIESSLSAINRLVMTPDGERLAVNLSMGSTRIYSALTGMPVTPAMSHLYQSGGIDMDRAGKRIVTGSWDFRTRVWDVLTGEPLCQPIPHRGWVHAVASSADGSRVLILSGEVNSSRLFLQCWRIPAKLEPRSFQPEGGRDLDGSRMSPDGRYLEVGTPFPKSSLTVYEVATGRILADRIGTSGGVYAAEYSPDSQRLYVLTNKGSCRGWSLPDMKPLWPDLQLSSGLQPGLISPDGKYLGAGCTDGVLRLVDTATGKLARELVHGALMKSVHFSPDSRRVLTAGADSQAAVWDVATGVRLATMQGHRKTILSTNFSPDGDRVVTGSYDFTARIWLAATGQQIGATMEHAGELSQVDFSPDGRTVATGARDGTARLWDGFTGQPLITPIARPQTVQTVQFLPDGRRFLTLDHGGFRFWDVKTGEAISVQYRAPLGGGLAVDSPTFHDSLTPDGRGVLLSNAHNAATLWRIPDPPSPTPAWFADFLDALATGGLGDDAPGGSTLPGAKLLEWQERAAHFQGGDYYENWVREVFGLEDQKVP